MTPLSNFHRQENTLIILKSFNYAISDIIEDVIVKNSLIHTIYCILEQKFAWDHEYINEKCQVEVLKQMGVNEEGTDHSEHKFE